MTIRQIELALNRGRLQERIASQRVMLRAQAAPLIGALEAVDGAVASGQAGLNYVRQHPAQLGLAIAALTLLKPRRVWRWGRRAFVVWGLWNKLRVRLDAAGLKIGRRTP
ncbi:MAG: YqjK-like family protein [Zoogloeaceae bacterium]|nr:YqjK-like family protein [Zoogloeaceae bacterium]